MPAGVNPGTTARIVPLLLFAALVIASPAAGEENELPAAAAQALRTPGKVVLYSLEGAARLFGGWEFGQRRPDDLDALPADLKKRLLDHSLKSSDADKLGRAKHAFAQR